MKYLKKFENHTQYDTFTGTSEFILPNVSICTTEGDVHYKPYVEPVETRVVAKFNVTSTSSPTQISYYLKTGRTTRDGTSGFSTIEFDDGYIVTNPSSSTTQHLFNTTGEHTVKYTLKDPTSIGAYAFGYCTSLTSIDIPNSVTSIGGLAFQSCISLTSVTMPNSVTNISNTAFNTCSSLTSIDIPNSVTSIGDHAFGYCRSLTSIDIPDSVTSIGGNAFRECSGLTSCTIGSGVTSIGDSVFYQCTSLTSCTIGSGVTSIGTYSFGSCSGLASIVIPNSVTSIGNYAFRGCSGLTTCTIGSGVTSIGTSGFSGCINLTSIVSNSMTAPTIQSNTFQDVNSDGTLTVPIGSSGYDLWMGTGEYYLGFFNWTKVEQ